MLLSLQWVRDFVPVDMPVSLLADRLTMAGIEVDEIIDTASSWNNVVIGEIIEINPHPNADRLSLTRVRAGESVYPVVCGAPNIAAGQKVPLALSGAVLPSGMTVKPSRIRGERSEGMICSEVELGIGSDTSGIMVLDDHLASGSSFSDALGLGDTVLSLGITPNRPDCFSIVGLAREMAALFDLPFTVPPSTLHENGQATEDTIRVRILDPDLCPRYACRYISGVSIQPSPLWMRRRLENSGMRSINNVVDITNYVLLEWGQPLHAFDYAAISGSEIIVRRAKPGETFVTLDGIERQSDSDVLYICDSDSPVALGGIMGGMNSGITEDTTSVLIESAYFDPQSIAGSCEFLKLSTDASERFKKGIDIQSVTTALDRAAFLMTEYAGGTTARGILDIYPEQLPSPKTVSIPAATVNRSIGIDLDADTMKSILNRLFISTAVTDDTLLAAPPSFRADIQQPVDLVEEIARVYGYENIPVTLPETSLNAVRTNSLRLVESAIRETLVSIGLHEVVNYSFFDPDILKHINFRESDYRLQPVALRNPLSSSQSVMRTTLIPSLIQNLSDNIHNGSENICIFEVSNVFLSQPDNAHPQETRRITGLLAGKLMPEQWNSEARDVDFFDCRGIVEMLLHRLRISTVRFQRCTSEPYLHPDAAVDVFIDKSSAGVLGEVHPDVRERFDIIKPVYIFDLDFNIISNYHVKHPVFKSFSRYPSVTRDIALVVDESRTSEELYTAISSYKNSLIADCSVFDVYTGEHMPPGKKSIAFRLKFQSDSRTLTDTEVNKIHDKILKYLHKAVGAELRS